MIFKFTFHLPETESPKVSVASGGKMQRNEALIHVLRDLPLGKSSFTRIDVEEVPPLTEEEQERAMERIRADLAKAARERGFEPPEIEFTRDR